MIDAKLTQTIDDAILNNGEFFNHYALFTREQESDEIECFDYVLTKLGKSEFISRLEYCYRELLSNSKKANLKRAFFSEKNIRLTDLKQYEKGLSLFKSKISQEVEKYELLAEKLGFYIQTNYEINQKELIVMIITNSPILNQEMKIIQTKIHQIRQYKSIEDVIANMSDGEGAGLGLVISRLIMRQLYMHEDCISYSSDNERSYVRFAIPLSIISYHDVEVISDMVMQEVNSLPQVPENIRRLVQMLEQEDVDIKRVVTIINQNPTLVMEILKAANSCYYRRNNEITKVEMAVNIMGINYLKSLIQSIGIQQVIDKKYTNLKQLWLHSQKIAQKSVEIVSKYKLKEIEEFIYVAALLHDIGKSIIVSLHKQAYAKILHSHKNLNIQILESILEGVTHTVVGSLMVKKWELPDYIASTIRYHHDPDKVNDEKKDIVIKAVNVIYFAHILVAKEENLSDLYDFEQEVCEYFDNIK